MVTELDKLVRAQHYIAKLAEGIDPITGEELPQDTVLNNVRLSRCFFYVSDVLSRMIEDFGKTPADMLPAFHITDEELRRVAVANEPVNVTTLIKAVCEAATGRKKLAAATVTGWLVQEGCLKSVTDTNGKSRKEVTPKGAGIGLYTEMREGPAGKYLAVLYPPDSQRFVLNHINDILAFTGAK